MWPGGGAAFSGRCSSSSSPTPCSSPIESLTHVNIFSSTLASHLHQQDWSPLAQALVDQRLAAKGLTLAAFAPAFDHAAVLNAKALIILMALAFVPFLPAFFSGAHRRFGAHVVFALHLYTFILLLFCLSLLLAEVELRLGGAGLASPAVDMIPDPVQSRRLRASISVFAIGAFYGSRGVPRIAKAAGAGHRRSSGSRSATASSSSW